MASNAKDKANLLNLPLELRQQIFHDYFKVEGGYVYDAKSDSLKTADNRPIELSLMSTCRSIANDTRHLPLTINTVKFSTLYREDWRSLAGCFNLVTSYYYILQSDFVIHLARFMTADMLAQLALKYPKFVPQLRVNMLQHQDYIAMVNDTFQDSCSLGERASTAEPGSENSTYNMNLTLCPSIIDNLGMYVDEDTLESYEYCSAFAALDTDSNHELREFWTGTFWEIQGGLSHCLQILAENKPVEFGHHVAKSFPCWTGERPVQDFMGLSFKPWEIPSESGVLHAIKLLQLRDVWKLPSMWHHTPFWRYEDDGDNNPQSNSNLDSDRRGELHNSSGVRCREKIRFSAVAGAIHFLQRRICADQRIHIRSLVLHEDLPSVNNPSCHVQDLAPFFRENPLLQVERHVDWLKCINAEIDSPFDVAAHFQLGWEAEPKLYKGDISPYLAHWLVDALAITDVGIPAEAFTFVLEPGPYVDYCTDIFQQYVHRDIAWSRVYKALAQSGSFVPGSLEWQEVGRYLLQDEDVEALDHLMNKTSPILRCDFNTGVAWDSENVVKETEGLDSHHWIQRWRGRFGEEEFGGRIMLPSDFTYESRVADLFEIQTEDDYLRPRRIDEEENL
ncbi:uncharacterized protein FTOL_03617 [Fusarium torulosum]|uniref:Uncharacterized protein n=1 Tax=Fusarium torulosum TaxID=33205 RepID=A0AAE8M4G1_9HYPO|nr:uncharacterized protein FTOL_03617 [Fusarium torulosum]